jgi:dethiobiotin synthetase
MRTYFVTGTDTGVGKTFVSAGILASLRRRGVATAALKPVETGCDPDAADGVVLRAAAGTALVPHTYRLPVAPAVAARLEGRPVSVEAIRAALASLRADFCLVEGAGGLLVPYADDLLAADLVAALALPLLVVARASLGTINHTLLTLAEARRRGLAVAGVILNRVVADVAPDEAHNAGEIERHARVRVLGTVPHVAGARDPLALADAVELAFDPVSALLR